MRELKFSCMWSDGKTWMDLRYTLDEMCNGKHWDDFSDQPMLKKFIHKHTRQYAGLKDKKGDEFFEGDVFQPLYNNFKSQIVTFKHGKFNICDFNFSKCLIIGNIYENKELIK